MYASKRFDVEEKVQVEYKPASYFCFEAANYIETWGWCQHTLEDPWHRVCMIGALVKVGVGKRGHMVEAEIVEHLYYATGLNSISKFNDGPKRTAAECVALFRHAGNKLREEGK
jgi:hypothetical protein